MNNGSNQRVYIARLILAVLLIMGLLATLIWFFFFRDNSPAKTASTKPETSKTRPIEAKRGSKVADKTQNAGESTGSTLSDAARRDSAATESKATPRPAPASTPRTASTTASASAANSKSLTNTGPGETAAAVFALAVITATTAKQLHLRRTLRG